MYIAGLNLSVSSSQALESVVVLSTIDFFKFLGSIMKTLAPQADVKAGRIRADTMPPLGKIVTGIHAVALHLPPLVYVGAVVYNGFRQPAWLARYALPDAIVAPAVKDALRVGACLGCVALKRLMSAAFRHLGDQWHALGRRERPRVVQTGPYAWVRHPMYSMALAQEVLWSVMFWSYVPLVTLGVTAAAFAVKMSIEESMIERDESTREEYRAYKKKVPARIIPYVW